MEKALVVTEGREVQHDSILTLATNMDISNKTLSGELPPEITVLFGLRSLNLSTNNLTGESPTNIGDMQLLDSIDLSGNQISGRIPPGVSTMHFLSYLDASFNNLSGEIPLSTQLQGFNPSSFIGNRLCGPPLIEKCSIHAMPPDAGNGSDNRGRKGIEVDRFYLGMVLGFVVGFWGICGPLLYSRS